MGVHPPSGAPNPSPFQTYPPHFNLRDGNAGAAMEHEPARTVVSLDRWPNDSRLANTARKSGLQQD